MLRFPFRSDPLLLILSVGFLWWFATINVIITIIQIVMFLTLTCTMGKYLFDVVEHRASGFEDAPKLSVQTLQSFYHFKHIQFALVVVLFGWYLGWLGTNGWLGLMWLMSTVFLLITPAFIALLTMSHSLLIAINPLAILRFIGITGVGYWLFCGYLLMAAIVVKMIGLGFIAIMLSLYFLCAGAYGLGKLVFDHRKALGFTPLTSPEQTAEDEANALEKARQQCLNRVYNARLTDHALVIIENYCQTEVEPLTAHRWFHHALLTWESKTVAKKHGKQYVEKLRAAGKTAMADHVEQELISYS